MPSALKPPAAALAAFALGVAVGAAAVFALPSPARGGSAAAPDAVPAPAEVPAEAPAAAPAAPPAAARGPVVERRVVTVTNVVTVARTQLVTNVINVQSAPADGGREPARLSVRKTAPYVVFCDVAEGADLRRRLSDCGARVISVEPRSRAVVEADGAAVRRLRACGIFGVYAMDWTEKVGTAAEGDVAIYPLSLIDEKPVCEAVRALGATPAVGRVGGRAVIRARLTRADVVELAARGDVRRIERDEGK
jgi:hypothetical protein